MEENFFQVPSTLQPNLSNKWKANGGKSVGMLPGTTTTHGLLPRKQTIILSKIAQKVKTIYENPLSPSGLPIVTTRRQKLWDISLVEKTL